MDEFHVSTSVFLRPATPISVRLGLADSGGMLRFGEGGLLGVDAYIGRSDAEALAVLDELTAAADELRALIRARMPAAVLPEVGP